ncbi:monovalent cation:proton antiporter-2 (CPA2) family protein, partial [Acidisphaera sp. L21]|uniref:monovalent cation:proton antiporter-2 (CPA2) family protein n=1 Tax=Acidisphaera sp. L21 TaxID=1641851 RepID=UPI00131E7ABE
MIATLVALLLASAICVPISRRLGFGSVLGYLVAGVAIGPMGLRLVSDVEQIATVSELGVVMLLFLIGLELRPQRLWVMRRSVFGLGAAQVVLSAAAITGLAYAADISWNGSIILGIGLALSSTAIVLPMLGERDLLGGRAGRDTFAVLLFQDLAFIPLVAIVPLMAPGQGAGLLGSVAHHVPWRSVMLAVGTVATILIGGRFLVPVVFRLIGGARTPEVFTATALLIVVGTAFLANEAGLSMSLGAFMAGVLLSDSEYRHELQADIEPFEGLLLGFFFMSVGMEADLTLLGSQPVWILGGVAALMLSNVVVALMLGRIAGQDWANAIRFAAALPQGSEFSFVLFAAAVAVNALTQQTADQATLVIAVSMAATPLMFAASEKFVIPRLSKRKAEKFDTIDENAPVIICGFGRVGQIVGRVLRTQGIPFIALEQDATQVEVLRKFGAKVYFGNPSRPDLLRSAGADTAKLLIVALDDVEEGLQVVDIARRTFPKLKILSRARNRRHAHLLMDRNITGIVRETFFSSLELTEMTLRQLGMAEAEAHRVVGVFREFDERMLVESHAY